MQGKLALSLLLLVAFATSRVRACSSDTGGGEDGGGDEGGDGGGDDDGGGDGGGSAEGQTDAEGEVGDEGSTSDGTSGDQPQCYDPEVADYVRKCVEKHPGAPGDAARMCQDLLQDTFGGKWQVVIANCGYVFEIYHSGYRCLVTDIDTEYGRFHALGWRD